MALRTASPLTDLLSSMRRVPGLRKHAERTASFVEALGVIAGLDAKERAHLREAAVYHDVGKVLLPTELWTKTGPFTDGERAMARLHVPLGVEVLRRNGVDLEVVRLVELHHEQPDGNGYPRGLTQVPLAAQLLRVADVYAALTEPRPYREALTPEAALRHLQEGAGRKYWMQGIEVLSAWAQSVKRS